MNKDNKIAYIKSVIRNMGDIDLSNENHSTLPCVKDEIVSYQLPIKMYEHRVELNTYDFDTENVIDVDYVEYEKLESHIIEQLLFLVQEWEEVQLQGK